MTNKVDVEQFLHGLGKTADEVSARLQRCGWRGTRGSSIDCPIARAVRGFIGPRPWLISVGTGTMMIFEEIGRAPFHVRIPEHVVDFIAKFDYGAWPELELSDPSSRRV